tara:strand:+ start:151 stop:777 length:627 start_codon:yes stop_codon:yes gene_type:complete
MLLVKSLRFDFSDDCKRVLENFSVSNQTADRKYFKEQWNILIKKEKELFETECNLLKERGFKGDPWDKLFKSARYYHRKKASFVKTKGLSQSRTYIKGSNALIQCVKIHINSIANLPSKEDQQYTMSYQEALRNFLETNKEVLINELRQIKEKQGGLEENIGKKIKKRYKEQFYQKRLEMMKNVPSIYNLKCMKEENMKSLEKDLMGA